MVYLAHFPVGGGEDGGFLRLSRVVQRRAHFLAQLAVVAVLALCATELLASASGLRSALFQDSEKDSQDTGSPPSTSGLQNSQSTPQNPPPPPQTSPVIPDPQTPTRGSTQRRRHAHDPNIRELFPFQFQ